MPSLPEPGPIRLIAVLGTLAILSWLISAVLLARSRRRTEALWSLGVLVLAGLTMAAGRLDATAHTVCQLLTVGVAGRNAKAFAGAPSGLTIVGIAAWIGSAVIAMRTFG